MDFRAGVGYDVHRLAEHRELIVGGVAVPYERGLIGHSDADVLTHAVIDSLLGAMGAGDIGLLFPDTDGRYEGVSSLKLLREVKNIMRANNFTVANIDAVLIAEAPRFAPYARVMEQNIARSLEIAPSLVNVKATTEEGLGFTGDGSGIAAKAVCMLKKNEKDEKTP